LPVKPRSKKTAKQSVAAIQSVIGQIDQEHPLAVATDPKPEEFEPEDLRPRRSEARRNRSRRLARNIREADSEPADPGKLEETNQGKTLEPEGKAKAAAKPADDDDNLYGPYDDEPAPEAKANANPAAAAKPAYLDDYSDDAPAPKARAKAKAGKTSRVKKAKGQSKKNQSADSGGSAGAAVTESEVSQPAKSKGTKKKATAKTGSTAVAARKGEEPIRLGALEALVAEQSFFICLRRSYPDCFLPDWSAVPAIDDKAFQHSHVVGFGGVAGPAVDRAQVLARAMAADRAGANRAVPVKKKLGTTSAVQVKLELLEAVPPCYGTLVQVKQEVCDEAEASSADPNVDRAGGEEQQHPESQSREEFGLADVQEELGETEELRRLDFTHKLEDSTKAFTEKRKAVIRARLAERQPMEMFKKLTFHWTDVQIRRQTTRVKMARSSEPKEQYLFRMLKACPAMTRKIKESHVYVFVADPGNLRYPTVLVRCPLEEELRFGWLEEHVREHWKVPAHQPGSMVVWTEAFGRIDRETKLDEFPLWNGDTVFLVGEAEFAHDDAVKEELGELLLFESNWKGGSDQRDKFYTHWKRLQLAILGEHNGLPNRLMRLQLLDKMHDLFLQKTTKSYRAFVPAILNSLGRYSEADKLELFKSCGVRPRKYDMFWNLLAASDVEAALRRSVKYPLRGDAAREAKFKAAIKKIDQQKVKAETSDAAQARVKEKQEDEEQGGEQEQEAPRRQGLRPRG